MRALCCMILILAVFLSSTLARPNAYENRDEQENAISATQKYLLRRYQNGKIFLKLRVQLMINVALKSVKLRDACLM